MPWKNMAGMKRLHHHLSHILALSLKGRVIESQAYTCQLLKAMHQMALDNGGWNVASLLLPGEDPCSRPGFAASEGEIERIVQYQESIRKLQAQSKRGGDGDTNDCADKEKPGKGDGKKK